MKENEQEVTKMQIQILEERLKSSHVYIDNVGKENGDNFCSERNKKECEAMKT